MKRLRQVLFILFALYILYLVKTALGINISHRYHAADFFKYPLRAIQHAMQA
jgi:hypothetical protein